MGRDLSSKRANWYPPMFIAMGAAIAVLSLWLGGYIKTPSRTPDPIPVYLVSPPGETENDHASDND